MLRFDHVAVVVDDLEAAVAFFVDLGFEGAGDPMQVEGDSVDRINGLDGVRSELVMLRAPDGGTALELCRYHAPAAGQAPGFLPANTPGLRHICLEVSGLEAILGRLRARGFGLVGEVEDYEDVYRLCYVRGPEGLIVELAERIGVG